jgi:hypothetical protein
MLNRRCKIRDELEDYVGKMLLMADKRRENILNNTPKLKNVTSGTKSVDKRKRRDIDKEVSIAEEEEGEKKRRAVAGTRDQVGGSRPDIGVRAPVKKKPRHARIFVEYQSSLEKLRAKYKPRTNWPDMDLIIIISEEETEMDKVVFRIPASPQAQISTRTVRQWPIRIPLSVTKAYREGHVNAIAGYLKWAKRYDADYEARIVAFLDDN